MFRRTISHKGPSAVPGSASPAGGRSSSLLLALPLPAAAAPARSPFAAPQLPLPEGAPARRLAATGLTGGGGPLPHARSIQAAFGHHDLTRVRTFSGPPARKAAAALRSEAFTQGGRIAFGSPRPGLFSAAHEAAHVIQQRQGIDLPGGVGRAGDAYEKHADAVAERVVQGRSATDLLDRPPGRSPASTAALDRPPTGLPGPVQKLDSKFDGPSDAAGVLVNIAYPGHGHHIAGGKPQTNCAITNTIVTNGERLNKDDSAPGNPTDFDHYRRGDDWDRTGGLVRDPHEPQAATRMHAINHRLDNTWTQNNAQNIFLGTARSNNPNHLNLVERPVIEAVAAVGDNGAYETALANAEDTFNAAIPAQDALFWPGALPGAVSDHAVKHAQLHAAVLIANDKTKGVNLGGVVNKARGDVAGQALRVNDETAKNNFFHPWVIYQVTPNYPAKYNNLPAYIRGNVVLERNEANALPKKHNADKVRRLGRIATFEGGWAVNAVPVSFTAKATYYTASYKKGTPYYQESEQDDYSTDL